ncbi:hypothetical protein HN832_04195 [archaeon]|jgi:hypothetical protein|nr:hypothetical protein [archaeon]MBT4373405.1 hypothetical protein [archaeon]MBT4531853.1 hypothetical protein [archaeon]MBT7001520.1 hypothetical protein [archaeon]MBT7282588.1 hypothetical protein [archaeon]
MKILISDERMWKQDVPKGLYAKKLTGWDNILATQLLGDDELFFWEGISREMPSQEEFPDKFDMALIEYGYGQGLYSHRPRIAINLAVEACKKEVPIVGLYTRAGGDLAKLEGEVIKIRNSRIHVTGSLKDMPAIYGYNQDEDKICGTDETKTLNPHLTYYNWRYLKNRILEIDANQNP